MVISQHTHPIKEPLMMDVWFVQDANDADVLALAREKWSVANGNATRNHYNAVCFSTEEEALDFCYEYGTDTLKWSPRLVTFETEQLH